MPRVSRKIKKKSLGYTKWNINYLRHGAFFDFLPEMEIFREVEAVREAWEIFRDEILYDWIRDKPQYGTGRPGPGTRPWAWWEFDAPELLRRVDGKPHPLENPERIAHLEKMEAEWPGYKERTGKLYFGKTACLFLPDDFEAQYEATFDLLKRHDMLLPGELEMVEAQQ
jgi:hypothetical protein